MEILDKLKILTDAAKYDVACTSSGSERGRPENGGMGTAVSAGICHSFAADGRCISLLKVLMTNHCAYDCKFCVNRRTNDVPRTAFTPRELADLTMNFYRRNYIEGLFLSSGILGTPDNTCERMIEALRILREEYGFNGYIHAKAIPGADSMLVARLGMLADRMSVNIELPSQNSLNLLAPDKSKVSILKPMGYITEKIRENSSELVRYGRAPKFAPAGQSTQMIIGASPETDFQILNLTESLYQRYRLKRVFFSAYIPVSQNPLLPALTVKPPLLREHRLYQADWLLRFYGFRANELLDEKNQSFNQLIDPKCNWAVNHMELFPVDVNRAAYETLLRVPGIGVKSARRITIARRTASLRFEDLKKLGIVLRRAQYFITCAGQTARGLVLTPDAALRALVSESRREMLPQGGEQLSFFAPPKPTGEDVTKCLTGQL